MNTHIPLNQKLYNGLQVALMWSPLNLVTCCVENHTLLPNKNQLGFCWACHFSRAYSKVFEPVTSTNELQSVE